jgi:hypothetical protein
MKILFESANMIRWEFSASISYKNIGMIRVDCMSENGTVECEGDIINVVKDGIFSGRWTISGGGNAVKNSAFSRRIDVFDGKYSFAILPSSLFGRQYNIESGNLTIGAINPNHLFTTSHSLELNCEMHIKSALLMSWFYVIMLRRSSSG